MPRKFGRDHVDDPRDKKYRLATNKTLRTSRTWRLGPVRDQKETPHCVGYAWSGWFNASPLPQHPMSPDGIYTLAQYFDEWQGQNYDGTSVRGAAKVLEITGHISEYRWEWDVDPAVNYLLTSGPLVVGLNWYAGMNTVDRSGYINVKGRLEGGHALLAYSANTKKEYVGLRNSWGPKWGTNGNAKITIENFARLLSEDGECCAAVERLVVS